MRRHPRLPGLFRSIARGESTILRTRSRSSAKTAWPVSSTILELGPGDQPGEDPRVLQGNQLVVGSCNDDGRTLDVPEPPRDEVGRRRDEVRGEGVRERGVVAHGVRPVAEDSPGRAPTWTREGAGGEVGRCAWPTEGKGEEALQRGHLGERTHEEPAVVARSTRPRTRVGCRKATCCAIIPPIEMPTMNAWSTPAWSRRR